MDSIRVFVKQKRKEFKLTQEELALNAGVGLRLLEIWNKVNLNYSVGFSFSL